MTEHGHSWVVTDVKTTLEPFDGGTKVKQIIARTVCETCGEVVYGSPTIRNGDMITFAPMDLRISDG